MWKDLVRHLFVSVLPKPTIIWSYILSIIYIFMKAVIGIDAFSVSTLPVLHWTMKHTVCFSSFVYNLRSQLLLHVVLCVAPPLEWPVRYHSLAWSTTIMIRKQDLPQLSFAILKVFKKADLDHRRVWNDKTLLFKIFSVIILIFNV